MTNTTPLSETMSSGDQGLLVGGLWGSAQPVATDPAIPLREWSADQQADLPCVILGHD